MDQVKLSLFLLLYLNIFYSNAMEKDPNKQRLPINASNLQEAVAKAIRYQNAIKAAENCDLAALKQYVDETNVNTVVTAKGACLLTLIFKKEHSNFTQAADYLLSLNGVKPEIRTTYENYSALSCAVGAAILQGRFNPLNYFLEKKANPFLKTLGGQSASLVAIESIAHDLTEPESFNRDKVISIFIDRVQNLSEALQTFHLPTIEKFASSETIKAIPEDDLKQLLQLANACGEKFKNNSRPIFELLSKHRALPKN
jgi:hypothetical protein